MHKIQTDHPSPKKSVISKRISGQNASGRQDGSVSKAAWWEFSQLAPTGQGKNRFKQSSDSIHVLLCMNEHTEIHRHTHREFKKFLKEPLLCILLHTFILELIAFLDCTVSNT